MTEARDRIEEVVGAEAFNPRKRYLVKASSNDAVFRLLLHDNNNSRREQRESFQLLHGAFVSGTSRGILLVGSNKELMYGIDVSFEEELLDDYEIVMNYMYDNYFKPFYECSVEELQQSEMGKSIEKVIGYVDQLDDHSFWTNYKIWRALNTDVNPSNITFPLPPSARLIPFQNAYWNAMKGKQSLTNGGLHMFSSSGKLTNSALPSLFLRTVRYADKTN